MNNDIANDEWTLGDDVPRHLEGKPGRNRHTRRQSFMTASEDQGSNHMDSEAQDTVRGSPADVRLLPAKQAGSRKRSSFFAHVYLSKYAGSKAFSDPGPTTLMCAF
jgi:hypothetical protein